MDEARPPASGERAAFSGGIPAVWRELPRGRQVEGCETTVEAQFVVVGQRFAATEQHGEVGRVHFGSVSESRLHETVQREVFGKFRAAGQVR